MPGDASQGSGSREGDSGNGGGMMGGGGMMSGGGMGGMMEKMGAPKPKELYPRLMALPDLPLEERTKIEEEAHQRMLDGAARMAEGFDRLTAAAPGSDFETMQSGTAVIRDGLAQFESGLAAHRAIAEGRAPRNVALQWFKREMNLLPPASSSPGFRFFGMSLFHTLVMVILAAFAVAVVWMYFFKMRRATELMQTLAAANGSLGLSSSAPKASGRPTTPNVLPRQASGTASSAPATAPVPPSPPSVNTTASPATTPAALKEDAKTETGAASDCCDETDVACADEDAASGTADISQGLLRIAKRRLCRLRVAQIFQETADVKTFRLVACHGGALPFNYLPGQFLTLTLPVGDKPIHRSYTISSSPTQGYYCEITVKREDQGTGSRYLHDVLKEGDTLEVQAPSGKFIFTGQEADSVVLISGGVGITPMMSITRALTDMGWPGEIHFLVACRDPEHFIFEDELKRLRQRHPNLHLHVAMSRIDKDINGYQKGRMTKELLQAWVPDIASQWIQLCGAPAMMEGTKQLLAELGVPAEQIHTEDFGSQHKPRPKAASWEQAEIQTETAASVTFQTSGKSTSLAPDETVLEAAERVDVEIDYSCRVGMCGVCTVKLLSGQVTMEADDGLEPEDREAGMILACQAKSADDITVEA